MEEVSFLLRHDTITLVGQCYIPQVLPTPCFHVSVDSLSPSEAVGVSSDKMAAGYNSLCCAVLNSDK